jgi:Lrp/AsnC family leucine-responsive transcriptional regulator
MLKDTIDRKLIEILMASGRISFADLAGLVGLSAPAVAERVRGLEHRGVIRGYAALGDPIQLGCAVTAFVAVALERPEHRAPFAELIRELPEVQECHHIAGDFDYMLKVRCAALLDLERIVGEHIKGLAGVVRTRTTIALSAVKETPALPLPVFPGSED